MAARFGATIVPFAAVGVDDGLEILLDASELEATPFIGDALRARAGGLPRARRGVSAVSLDGSNGAGGGEESFVAPLVAPRFPPKRMYFIFQKPIVTSPSDTKDRERCEELYRETKGSVEQGLRFLLERRNGDPYGDFAGRALYEAATGRQAPTFPF
jgi:hypothetical protein